MTKPTLTEQVKALTERVEKLESMIKNPPTPPIGLATPMQVQAQQHIGYRNPWELPRWPDPKLSDRASAREDQARQ